MATKKKKKAEVSEGPKIDFQHLLCPACGSNTVEEVGTACRDCHSIRSDGIGTALSFIKSYAMYNMDVGGLLHHGPAFIGRVQQDDEEVLKNLNVSEDDAIGVLKRKNSLKDFLDRFMTAGQDRWPLLRFLLKVAGKKARYLPVSLPKVRPRTQVYPMTLDRGDRDVLAFYVSKNGLNDTWEQARQVANRIFIQHKLEQDPSFAETALGIVLENKDVSCIQVLARGITGEPNVVGPRLDKLTELAITTESWWAFASLADAYKAIGNLGKHHECMHTYRDKFVTSFNERNHI